MFQTRMMCRLTLRSSVAATLLGLCIGAMAQTKAKDDELDALELKPEPAKAEAAGAPKASTVSPSRLVLEGAIGRSQLRYGLDDENSHRLSLDWRYAGRIAPQWRLVLSDRIDHVKPSNGDRTINTLREAYLGWQSEDAGTAIEFGRINLRTGPGYGYNPSDFFRDGSLRATTTLDPIALRDIRMGSVGLRAQRLWSGGGLSFVLSPKLDDSPSAKGASLDLGSTNHSTRVQLAWSQDLAAGVNMQAIAFKQNGESARLGISATALMGGSVVAHVEGALGREVSLADRVFGVAGNTRSGSRLVAGFTVALPGSLSLTAELQHNSLALSEAQWAALVAAGGPAALGGYLQGADRQQDLASRRAALIYLSKKGLFTKGLDLTAFVQVNTDDNSRLSWLELKRQLGSVDLALQWQQLQGSALSQFGIQPLRRSVQLVVTTRL